MLKLRRWTLKDTQFTLFIRNHPDLMRWFRQDAPLTEEKQVGFIEYDLLYNKYYGCILEKGLVPIGVTNLNQFGEFGLAILPPFQSLTREALRFIPRGSWSEVFLDDPRLPLYLNNGFRMESVKERAYYKEGRGLLDVIKIRKEHTSHENLLKVPKKASSDRKN